MIHLQATIALLFPSMISLLVLPELEATESFPDLLHISSTFQSRDQPSVSPFPPLPELDAILSTVRRFRRRFRLCRSTFRRRGDFLSPSAFRGLYASSIRPRCCSPCTPRQCCDTLNVKMLMSSWLRPTGILNGGGLCHPFGVWLWV